ncbi:cupin domain-containing protein [Psychroserpens sp. MEBiC05023]
MDIDISNIPQREIIPGYKARFIHSERMTTAYWDIEKNAELPLHSHMHEQIAIVTKGEFQMTVNGITNIYKPGMLLVIPPHVEHSGKALTHCEITDIFSPVREDYK